MTPNVVAETLPFPASQLCSEAGGPVSSAGLCARGLTGPGRGVSWVGSWREPRGGHLFPRAEVAHRAAFLVPTVSSGRTVEGRGRAWSRAGSCVLEKPTCRSAVCPCPSTRSSFSCCKLVTAQWPLGSDSGRAAAVGRCVLPAHGESPGLVRPPVSLAVGNSSHLGSCLLTSFPSFTSYFPPFLSLVKQTSLNIF